MANQPTEEAANLSTSGPKVRVENDCSENIPPSRATSYTFAPKVSTEAGGRVRPGYIVPPEVKALSDAVNTKSLSNYLANLWTTSMIVDENITLLDASVNCTVNSASFKPKTLDEDFGATDCVSYSPQSEAQNLTEEVVRSAPWTEPSSPSTSAAKCDNTTNSLELSADVMDEPQVLSNTSIGSEASELVPEIATEARGELLHILPPSVKNKTLPFSDTTDISVEDATVNSTINDFSSPPKTPVSMRLEEEVVSKADVDKPVAAQGNLTQTMSLNSSTSSRVNLDGTHNISTFEDKPEMKHSLKCGIQNQTVEMSETPLPMTDAECDSKINQGTFNLCGESTEDLQIGSNSTMTIPKHVSTTTELPQTNVKTVSSYSNTLHPPLNSTTTFLETVHPLNNTFEAHTSNLNVAATEMEKPLNTFKACPPEEFSVATTVDDTDGVASTHQNNTFETNISNQFSGMTTETNGQTISHQNMAVDAKPSMTILSTTTGAEASIKMISARNNTFDTLAADIQSLMKLQDTFSESAESVKMGSPHNKTFEDPMFPKLDRKTKMTEDTDTVSCTGTEAKDNVKMVGLPKNADEAQIPLPLTGIKADANGKAEKNLMLPLSITPPSLPVEIFTADVDNGEQNMHSMPDQSWKDISDSLCNQSVETETNKATFSLDGTLELGNSSSLITSTPMPNSRVAQLKFEWEEGKTLREQQKRCVDVLLEPTTQLPTESNITIDRKMLFKPGAPTNVRSLKPPTRPASQLPSLASLPKTKSSTSGTSELPVFALPDARRITRAIASRNATAAVSQEGSISALGVHTAIPESKLPSIGLRKRPNCSLQSGIQRSLPPPIPLPERASAVSSNDKPSGIAGALRSKSKTVQTHNKGQKHPLTGSEAFPLAKRKKIVPPSKGAVPSVSTQPANPPDDAEILGQSTSRGAQMCTNETARGARILKRPASSLAVVPTKQNPGVKQLSGTFTSKQPTKAIYQAAPTTRGAVTSVSTQMFNSPDVCANCLILQQELEQCRQEIKRMQEELRNRDQMDM
ncbi:uncharacterized protein LOC124475534 isoform X2 [Hypomesus transpacificus]|nr:uncharacterized protein LOC124475534 isoform X2 [Hypomesus transpacificus]